jgi:hypothetical protein
MQFRAHFADLPGKIYSNGAVRRSGENPRHHQRCSLGNHFLPPFFTLTIF